MQNSPAGARLRRSAAWGVTPNQSYGPKHRGQCGDEGVELLDYERALARLGLDQSLSRPAQSDGRERVSGLRSFPLHREPGGYCLLPGRDGLVHCLVDAEDLRQPGDLEDLQDPLLGADQIQRAVMRPHPLQAADQHPQAGGVEEPDLLQVDDELVVVLADQIDEQLTQPRRGVDVDLALDVDDLDAVLAVVDPASDPQVLQRHARRHLNVQPGQWAGVASAESVILCSIQPRSVIISTRNHAFGHPRRGTH